MNKITLSNGKEITFRTPKVRDVRAVNDINNAGEKEIALFCNLTGLTQEEMDDLLYSDYIKMQEMYEGLVFQAGVTS